MMRLNNKRKISFRTHIFVMILLFLLCVPFGRVHAATVYTINGKSISYTDFSSSKNECWVYARNVYNKIWGYGFDALRSSSDNCLRNLSASELRLTADHLRAYVSGAPLGACLRVCTGEYLDGYDGWGHSQIIVQKDANGFTVIQGGLSAFPHCNEQYYTWGGYMNSYFGRTYQYIKYIKYGNATAIGTATASINISPTIAKTTMNKGETCIVGGTVSSTGYNIASVTAGVYRNADGSGGAVNGIEATRRPNSTYFNISNVDPVLYFQNIVEGGTYFFVVKATLTNGTTRSANKQFTVRGNQCGQPTISSPSDILGGKHISISGGSADTIFYTVWRNNSVVDQGSFVGSGSFSKDYKTVGNYHVESEATRSGYTKSNTAKLDFSISQVAPPSVSQTATSTNMVINIASGTAGASIFYTTSGNNPSTSSTRFNGAITLTESKTLKAIAVKNGMADSSITSYNVRVEEPDTPSGLSLTSESIIPEGDSVSVKWSSAKLAADYVVTLYQDGKTVNEVITAGTSASFILPNAGEYSINVYARNFVRLLAHV